MPAQGDPEAVLARAISPPHFPITPSQLRGKWRFEAIEEGEHEIEGFTVLAREIPHKGGRMFGYRVSHHMTSGSAVSIAYLSDHWPVARSDGPDGLGDYHDAALELASGVDVLVHDSQYTAEEFEARRDFGHSAAEYALGLAMAAHARSLVLFHHDPSRTDDQLDEIVASFARAPVPVSAAREGMVLDL